MTMYCVLFFESLCIVFRQYSVIQIRLVLLFLLHVATVNKNLYAFHCSICVKVCSSNIGIETCMIIPTERLFMYIYLQHNGMTQLNYSMILWGRMKKISLTDCVRNKV